MFKKINYGYPPPLFFKKCLSYILFIFFLFSSLGCQKILDISSVISFSIQGAPDLSGCWEVKNEDNNRHGIISLQRLGSNDIATCPFSFNSSDTNAAKMFGSYKMTYQKKAEHSSWNFSERSNLVCVKINPGLGSNIQFSYDQDDNKGSINKNYYFHMENSDVINIPKFELPKEISNSESIKEYKFIRTQCSQSMPIQAHEPSPTSMPSPDGSPEPGRSPEATTTPPEADVSSYGLPLQVKLEGECGLPGFTRYSVSTDGQFTWTEETWPTLTTGGNPPVQSRLLSATEQYEVTNFLNFKQLLAASQQSESIPADDPQTKECRTVTVYTLQAAGQNQSFEGQDTRKFRHSKALLAQLEALQNLLKRLSEK